MPMKKRSAVLFLLAILSCFAVIYIVGMYASNGSLFATRNTDVLVVEDEFEDVIMKELHGYPFKAKSWNTGVVTRCEPSLSARCNSLWAGEEQEVRRVKRLLRPWRNAVSDKQFLEQLHNCTYVQEILYDNFYTSPVETEFPLAFLMTIHEYPQQVVRLLRVLYRPQNVYCFHVDAKAKPEVIESFRSLSRCVPNVLMPKNLVEVYRIYGESVLEAQLSCFEVLHSAHNTWKWRYVMNLCGTELPLVTNRKMVEQLKKLNNTTSIYSDDFPDSLRNFRFGRRYKPGSGRGKPFKSKEYFGKPPYGMQLYKSSTYSIMTFRFTDFILTHPKAIALRNYIRGASSAEEHFYITLFHLPEAPVGKPPIHQSLSASIWMFSDTLHTDCNGVKKHDLCIAGVGTMKYIDPKTKYTSDFFFNKYNTDNDHVIMDCMEKRVVANNKLEYLKDCTQGKTCFV